MEFDHCSYVFKAFIRKLLELLPNVIQIHIITVFPPYRKASVHRHVRVVTQNFVSLSITDHTVINVKHTHTCLYIHISLNR